LPRFLALDWDGGHVHLLSATVAKGGLRLERALAWPEEQPPGAANAEGFGQRLRERLREAGVAPAPLLAAVGRDRVVLKEVRYPQVPPHEEPGVVRFQAVKELTDAGDDVVIDYQAAGAPEPTGERKALAVALRRDILQAYQTLARAAGVKLAGVTPRAFGVIACLRRAASPEPEPGTAFAALTVGERGGEFLVARGDNLAFARALSGPALASDTALLGEIRRNLAVYAGQASQHPVRALYVAEDSGPALGVGDRLRDTLAIPVHRFDPLGGLGPPAGAAPGSFAGAAGLLHLQGRGRGLPVNFVKPREPKPPRDPNRRLYTLAACAAAVLVLAVGGWGYSKVAAKDKKLRELVDERADLDQQLIVLGQDETRLKELDKWTGSDIPWLDELYNLTARFPDINKLRLTKFMVQPHSGGAKDKHVALVKLEGLQTNEANLLMRLQTAMVEDGFLNVQAPEVKPNQSGQDRLRFPRQWSMNYEVAKRPPAKYDIKFTAIPPPRNRRDRPPGGDFGDLGLGGELP
jgi:hypothetical protein